jgi:hypothetical protein
LGGAARCHSACAARLPCAHSLAPATKRPVPCCQGCASSHLPDTLTVLAHPRAPLVARRQARARVGGRLCVRRLIVGTGDLGFSTVHRLANLTARRRPAQPLWGVFIDKLLRRLDDRTTAHLVTGRDVKLMQLHATRLARTARSPRHYVHGAGHAGCMHLPGAVMVVKHGRRALLPTEYAPLLARAERSLGAAVVALDAGRTPLRLQLAHTRRAAVGISPDGGSSFILSFLPRGGALVIFGALERWLWSADGRLRAFYCQPQRRDARFKCPGSSPPPPPFLDAAAPRGDCYTLDAVSPCAQAMLSRAREHVLHSGLTCARGGRTL